jgi:hypothetical protein
MARLHDPYCDRSAALGEGFPDLIGGVLGLAIGLTRGSVRAARRIAEDAIWMDPGHTDDRAGGCGCCEPVHRVVICDCGPWVPRAGGCCCG